MAPSPPAVSSETLGAWVLVCNPRLTDPAVLADRGVEQWCVAANYRRRLMTAGQPVLLWLTGARPARYARGFWAAGELTGPAARAASGGFHVPLTLRFWSRPVEAGALDRTDGLPEIEVLRQPQIANPSFLDVHQWARLQMLLPR